MKNPIGIFKAEWLVKATPVISDPKKVRELLTKVTELLGEEGLKEAVANLKVLVNYIQDVLSGAYKNYAGVNLALAVAAIIYVVSPVDVIPDFFLGGFVDDVGIVAWAIKQLHEELNRYREAMGKE